MISLDGTFQQDDCFLHFTDNVTVWKKNFILNNHGIYSGQTNYIESPATVAIDVATWPKVMHHIQSRYAFKVFPFPFYKQKVQSLLVPLRRESSIVS